MANRALSRGKRVERGFELLAVPVFPTAPFLPSVKLGPSAIPRVKLLRENWWWTGENNFLGFVLQGTTPELPEKTQGARGTGPWTRSISRVSGTGTPTSLGYLRSVSIFFFNFPHPAPPTLPSAACRPGWEKPRAGPTLRRGLTCALGRCRKEGRRAGARPGRPDGLRGSRGAAKSGARGDAAGGWRRPGHSSRGSGRPQPRRHALDARRSRSLAVGGSGVRAQPGCRSRARASPPRPLPLPRRSARGAGARGRRPAGPRRARTPAGSGPAPRARPWGRGGAGRARALGGDRWACWFPGRGALWLLRWSGALGTRRRDLWRPSHLPPWPQIVYLLLRLAPCVGHKSS